MKFKLIAASALLAAAAFPAAAQESPSIPLVLTPISTGISGVTLDRNVSGLFVDTFTFTPMSFGGTVAVNLKTAKPTSASRRWSAPPTRSSSPCSAMPATPER